MSLARINEDAVHHTPGQVTEGARHREARIVADLRHHGPGLLEDIQRGTGHTQSRTIADLTMLADAGTLVQHVYALPGQRVEVR